MSDVPEPARIEISKSKALALADITEKIARLCSDQVSSHPDVNRWADMLSQIRAEVLTRSTLAPLLGTVDSGIAALSETRKRLENLEKDQQILRKIRQVKSASINSLEGSREAIAEISAHIAALQEADSVPADISALLAELQTRADGFCQRLTQVRNKLSLVTSLDKLAELQRDYNQLDLVFRSSELEDTYAALDAEFAFLKEDLERVKMLENAAAGADTVMSVCSGIASASSIGPLLHESARYEDRVQSAHSTLAGQLEGYGENLTALGKAVNRTNTKSEAESLWQEILAQSSIYKRSELEGRYLRVCREAELLLSLLRVQKPRAIMASEQDCAAALQQLDEWQSEVTDGSPALLQRALAYKSEIVSCSEEISAARRQAAHNWVISVVEASTSLFSAGVSPTAAPAVYELLERLSLETPAKRACLDDIDKAQLDSVREQCETFLESDRESKILFLLHQMPLEKQEEIVRRLAKVLNLHLVEP